MQAGPDRDSLVSKTGEYFVTDPSFMTATINTPAARGQRRPDHGHPRHPDRTPHRRPFPGRNLVRILLISPFFIMPTVNALLWKHMMMNPTTASSPRSGSSSVPRRWDWLTDYPLLSVIAIVSPAW